MELTERLNKRIKLLEEITGEDKLEAIIRKSISEEQLAVSDYLKRAAKLKEKAEDHPEDAKIILKVAKTFAEIADEEKAHIGEFEKLLDIIGVDRKPENNGRQEV